LKNQAEHYLNKTATMKGINLNKLVMDYFLLIKFLFELQLVFNPVNSVVHFCQRIPNNVAVITQCLHHFASKSNKFDFEKNTIKYFTRTQMLHQLTIDT
jgi:hypothetical protein